MASPKRTTARSRCRTFSTEPPHILPPQRIPGFGWSRSGGESRAVPCSPLGFSGASAAVALGGTTMTGSACIRDGERSHCRTKRRIRKRLRSDERADRSRSSSAGFRSRPFGLPTAGKSKMNRRKLTDSDHARCFRPDSSRTPPASWSLEPASRSAVTLRTCFHPGRQPRTRSPCNRRIGCRGRDMHPATCRKSLGDAAWARYDLTLLGGPTSKWRNRQTRQLEGLVPERAWGFKSPLRHDLLAVFPQVSDLRRVWITWLAGAMSAVCQQTCSTPFI